MTIRRILLLAFLLVSLLPATVLTVLAFSRTRAAMQAEIEQGVLRSAAAASTELDKFLFERLLNATTWNHLEVMQDLRLDDVDKRLSGFLGEMKRRYGGVYLELLAVAPDGRVVAASDPARIGTGLAASTPWLRTRLAGGEVRLDVPADAHGSGSATQPLRMRSAIESQFDGAAIGDLVLEIDWAAIESLLDRAAAPSRELLVLDQENRLLAASAALRRQGLVRRAALPAWLRSSQDIAIQQRDGQPLLDAQVIVGHQRSPGAGGFSGFGWSTWLLQSRDIAMAPVHHMAWAFAGLLALTVLITVAMAFWVSSVIARPVLALTRYTRGYLRPGPQEPAPPQGPGEIGELNRSFVRLVQDLQQSQHTLVQASKLAALGEVTALLAHEVRTPLGILRSSAQMLRTETGMSEEGRELLRIIESETGRLNRLVSSMLDSARTRAPQRRPEDLHALIAHAVSLLSAQARDRGITLQTTLGAQMFVVDCDAEQITQVLLNLCMNALQILPRGGQVQIATRNQKERLAIEVADDGPGVPAEDRARIFEPFVFKREGGVGLGLAVVRQIVKSHGGEIVAEQSTLGGALFRVLLPVRNPENP